MALGKPSISDPRVLDLRALQMAVSNIRQRLEGIEAEIVALQSGSAASSAATIAALTTRIDNIVLGNGTVTSVAATVPNFLSVSGTPITTAGTLAFSLATQPSGYVFAGPIAGADAAPSFRPLEWYYDLPLFSTMSFTSGLDGSEIIAIERYGDFYWTTLADVAALLSEPLPFAWNSQAGDYTLQASDMENGVSTSGTTGTQTITIPSGLTGNAVLIYVAGAAGVQVVPASGVNLRVRSGLTAVLAGQYAVATLIRRSTDEWFIAGDLAS